MGTPLLVPEPRNVILNGGKDTVKNNKLEMRN
jgi:hypothetical protein